MTRRELSKLRRWFAVYVLYGIGHACSWTFHIPIVAGFLYRPYNWCMVTSSELDHEAWLWKCFCICHGNTDSRVLCGCCQ